MTIRGQSLELFFIDGTPEGMLTAKIFNWTGQVLMTPRIRLPEALKREEAGYTGVYILIGDSDGSNLVRVYVGEGEDIADRIRNHDAKKEWWTRAVLITGSANGLNKAHAKFLESRLVEEAKKAGRMDLENHNTPPRPSLSESAQANMEQFVDFLMTVLPAIGVDGFLVKTRPKASPISISNEPINRTQVYFKLVLANGEVDATASLENGEFVVQSGSTGRGKWIGVEHNYQKLFDEVLKSGIYVGNDTQRRFSEAYAFSSPSAAGAVLNGRATAGPISWVLAGNEAITYKQWEKSQLEHVK